MVKAQQRFFQRTLDAVQAVAFFGVGLHQNGDAAAQVPTQDIGEKLVTDEGGLPRADAKLLHLGQGHLLFGLGGIGNVAQPQAIGKGRDPQLVIIRNDKKAQPGRPLALQPVHHLRLYFLAVITGQGVIHIQEQGTDAMPDKKIRWDLLDAVEIVLRGQKRQGLTLLSVGSALL